ESEYAASAPSVASRRGSTIRVGFISGHGRRLLSSARRTRRGQNDFHAGFGRQICCQRSLHSSIRTTRRVPGAPFVRFVSSLKRQRRGRPAERSGEPYLIGDSDTPFGRLK